MKTLKFQVDQSKKNFRFKLDKRRNYRFKPGQFHTLTCKTQIDAWGNPVQVSIQNYLDPILVKVYRFKAEGKVWGAISLMGKSWASGISWELK